MNNTFLQFWSNPDNILNASISQMQQFQEQVMSGLFSQKLNFPHMGLMREELDNITETVNAGQDYITALTKFLQSFSMPYAEGLLEFVKCNPTCMLAPYLTASSASLFFLGRSVTIFFATVVGVVTMM